MFLEAERDEGLRHGAPREAEQVTEQQGLAPAEGAFLTKGGQVCQRQAPEGGEQGRGVRSNGHRLG